MENNSEQEIDYFSLDGFVFKDDDVKVCKVYDGDSITLILPLHSKLYKWRCRLFGIDTPEIRGGTVETKEKGYEARDIVRELLMVREDLLSITVLCGEFDKYGRVLIKVALNHTKYGHIDDLSEWLIKNGYGEKYMI